MYRRPILSQSHPLTRHPISVPMQRRPTIVPCLAAENFPSSPKRSRKSVMARKPEICPDSYPNMKPPMDAIEPRRIASHVTGSSLNASSVGMTLPWTSVSGPWFIERFSGV